MSLYRHHFHTCETCGDEWRCDAGAVWDGDRPVCCEVEFDAHGKLYCSEECEAQAREEEAEAERAEEFGTFRNCER